MKVAQVGRRIAEYLLKREPQELIDAVGGIDPDVVETAGLVHDLGHPPFGHIAEEELDSALLENGVADGFEGNAQSFRIVSQVAIKKSEYPGLNLTRASLNAALKYPWGRGVEGKESKKWGYYHSEREDFNFARALSGAADRRQSAEAALMDWADDVAYSVHDVDDFYRAGLIPLDRIIAGTEERDQFIDIIYGRWEEEERVANLAALDRNDASKFFDNLEVLADEIVKPFSGTYRQRAQLDFLSSFLIRRYIIGTDEPEEKAITLAASGTQPFVQIEPTLRAEVDLLKGLMQYYVFNNPALLAQQLGQRRVVRELFEILFKAAHPTSHNRGLIPHPFYEGLTKITEPSDSPSAKRQRARIVADIIASMTEQQAILLHQRLMGISPGSVRDVIVW